MAIKAQKTEKYICLLKLVLAVKKELLQFELGLYSTIKMHRTPMATMIAYNKITAKSVPLEKLLLLVAAILF